MISVNLRCDESGHIYAFTAQNHGATLVCAAVSLLALNTVNSIEALTEADFSCEYKEDGGFIQFALNGAPEHDAGLLLDAMALGLRSVRDRYPDEIALTESRDERVHDNAACGRQ